MGGVARVKRPEGYSVGLYPYLARSSTSCSLATVPAGGRYVHAFADLDEDITVVDKMVEQRRCGSRW
jgi:hypothetical protein